MLIGAGLLNSIGCAAESYPCRVLTGAQASVTLGGNVHDALIFIRENSPSTAIVDNPLVHGITSCNPTTTVAARRSLLPIECSRINTIEQPETMEHAARWSAWLNAGYPPGDLSAEFARKADFVVVDQQLPLYDWQQAAAFGKIRIFTPRKGATEESLIPAP